MANVRRLVELGMPPALAKEVAVDGGGTPGPATTSTAGVVKQASVVQALTGPVTSSNVINTYTAVGVTYDQTVLNNALTVINNNATDVAGKVNHVIDALKKAGIMSLV